MGIDEPQFKGDATDAKAVAVWIDARIADHVAEDGDSIFYSSFATNIAQHYNDLLAGVIDQWPLEDGLDFELLQHLYKQPSGLKGAAFQDELDRDEIEDGSGFELHDIMFFGGFPVAKLKIWKTDGFPDGCELLAQDTSGAIEGLYDCVPSALALSWEIEKWFPDVASNYRNRKSLSVADQQQARDLYFNVADKLSDEMNWPGDLEAFRATKKRFEATEQPFEPPAHDIYDIPTRRIEYWRPRDLKRGSSLHGSTRENILGNIESTPSPVWPILNSTAVTQPAEHDPSIRQAKSDAVFTGDIKNPKDVADWMHKEIALFKDSHGKAPLDSVVNEYDRLLRKVMGYWPVDEGLNLDILQDQCPEKKLVRTTQKFDMYKIYIAENVVATYNDEKDYCVEPHRDIYVTSGLQSLYDHIPLALAVGAKLAEKYPQQAADYKNRLDMQNDADRFRVAAQFFELSHEVAKGFDETQIKKEYALKNKR